MNEVLSESTTGNRSYLSDHTSLSKLTRIRIWPGSSIFLTIFGVALTAIGFYFIALRPAFLPEDLRFIGLAPNQMNTVEIGLSPWLHQVFRVLGGYILGLGVLNITLATTSFRAHNRMAAAGVLISGLLSIALMTTINFQIDSDFKWILLSIAVVWLSSLGLFWLETRREL